MTSRRVGERLLIGAIVSLAAACSPTAPSRVATGVWGGDHIRLDVAAGGAVAEYDCAHGTIDEPLIVDSSRRFSAAGTHTFEHGGPIRSDEPPNRHPARYEGQIAGETLQLVVTIVDSGQVLGPFSMQFNRGGRVFKCV